MRFDKVDLAIIAHSYHRPRIPATEVAKRLGIRVPTFRRRLNLLLEAGVMRQKAFPNLYALGYCQYEVSLSLASTKKSQDQRFIQALVSSEDVAWIGQYSGEYQYTFTICKRTPQEFHDALSQLLSLHQIHVVKTQIATRLRYSEFPLRILHPAVARDNSLEFGEPANLRIDAIDQQILRSLSLDSSITTRALAEEVGISQGALVQRIERLKEQKILLGFTYVVDFSKLGLQAFCLLIKVRNPGSDVAAGLLNFARKTPEFSYFAQSFGAYDFKLGVLVKDSAKILLLSQLVAEHLADNLLAMQTLTAFDYLKVERYPFRVQL